MLALSGDGGHTSYFFYHWYIFSCWHLSVLFLLSTRTHFPTMFFRSFGTIIGGGIRKCSHWPISIGWPSSLFPLYSVNRISTVIIIIVYCCYCCMTHRWSSACFCYPKYHVCDVMVFCNVHCCVCVSELYRSSFFHSNSHPCK